MLLSIGGLLVAAPVIALAGIGLALSSGFPIFFRQTRVGRCARPFTLVKLRTMHVTRSALNVTASDDARVTRLGRFLRRSKLDELPELWNILKGDMSFVGPRPEVPQYVDPESPAWREVLLARPGLTDPVTLRFRNEELLMGRVEGDRDAFYRETLQPAQARGLPRLPPAADLAHGCWRAIRNGSGGPVARPERVSRAFRPAPESPPRALKKWRF